MAYKMGTMAILKLSNNAEWRKKMIASIERHQGTLAHVAEDLDIGYATIKRWVGADAELKALVDSQREDAAEGEEQPRKVSKPTPKKKAPQKVAQPAKRVRRRLAS